MVGKIACLLMAVSPLAVSARHYSARFIAQQTLRATICEQDGNAYDVATGRCFNPRLEPSEYNCALVSERFEPSTKSCVVPSAENAPAASKKERRWLTRDPDTPDNAACKALDMIFDPATNKCFNPSLHPSICNCGYLGLNFNAATNDCNWSDADQAGNQNCLNMALLWNPDTQKCYNPSRHPSICNCEYYALSMNPTLNVCVPFDPSLPSTPSLVDNSQNNDGPSPPTGTDPNAPFPSCQYGQLPDYTTKQCVPCTTCAVYPLNVGTQVCQAGQCSVICPDGNFATNRWGVQTCS